MSVYNFFKRNVFILAITPFTVIGQSKTDEMAIQNWYDQTVGLENLEVNKGVIYKNNFATTTEDHNFYGLNEFQSGAVFYNNQSYYNVDLKYDILNDQLVVSPKNQTNGIEIIVDKSKTARFEIQNRKFVLLGSLKNKTINFEQGFYEERIVAKDFVLFIKHKKTILNRIVDDRIVYYFPIDANFFLAKENSFFKINSKSDIINLFPNQKDQIKDFYKANSDLKQKDKQQFMTDLFSKLFKN